MRAGALASDEIVIGHGQDQYVVMIAYLSIFGQLVSSEMLRNTFFTTWSLTNVNYWTIQVCVPKWD